MKLKHDRLSFAFNFIMRRCSAARSLIRRANKAGIRALVAQQFAVAAKVGRCRLTPIIPTLTPPKTERLQLQYDVTLSSFAFNFNLRRYVKVLAAGLVPIVEPEVDINSDTKAGKGRARCCLPPD